MRRRALLMPHRIVLRFECYSASITSGIGTLRQFAALQRRVRSRGQTRRHRRASLTGESDPEQTLKVDRLVGSLGGSVVERVG